MVGGGYCARVRVCVHTSVRERVCDWFCVRARVCDGVCVAVCVCVAVWLCVRVCIHVWLLLHATHSGLNHAESSTKCIKKSEERCKRSCLSCTRKRDSEI